MVGTTDVTCPVTLGNQVRIINQAQITWKLTLYPGTARAFTITLATMNQTVYFTYGKSVTTTLDDNGNEFVVALAGPSCATGTSLVQAELTGPPYTTLTTQFTVLAPRVTV